jgi:hypothetical protein
MFWRTKMNYKELNAKEISEQYVSSNYGKNVGREAVQILLLGRIAGALEKIAQQLERNNQ